MDDPTPAAPQTPESTGLPADLFEKAQVAATEKGRPIYVYRTERAGRHTSKWEPVAGATPAAVIEPLPKRDGQPPTAATLDATPERVITEATPNSATAADGPREVPAPALRQGERVTLYAAGGQTVEWERATDLHIEEGGRVVGFHDANGAAVRVVVGGGSVSVVTPAHS